MTSDERATNDAGSTPSTSAADGSTGERVYDSFVVRLWREVGNPRLLRVEVAHAQSGGVASVRGVEVDCIGALIVDLVGEPRSPHD